MRNDRCRSIVTAYCCWRRRPLPSFISQKSLTQTLRTLKEDGFISREVFPEIPPRVEYSLTPRALYFLPLVENIINWAKENMEEIMADRAKNKQCYPNESPKLKVSP